MARKRKVTPGPYLLYVELVRDRVTNPNTYPYSVPALRHLQTLEFHPKVTFLLGENGTGKLNASRGDRGGVGLEP